MTAFKNFIDGPWNNRCEECFTAIPTMYVPVYADPPEGAVCADEQVITLLGYYDRDAAPIRSKHFTRWIYNWRQAQ